MSLAELLGWQCRHSVFCSHRCSWNWCSHFQGYLEEETSCVTRCQAGLAWFKKVVLSNVRIRWWWTLCVWVYPQWFLATFSEVLHRKVAENSHIWNQCYSPLGFGFAISNTFKSTVFLSLSHICNWLTDRAWSVKVYHLTWRKTNQQKTSKTIPPSPPCTPPSLCLY